jgi:hypothetical protein
MRNRLTLNFHSPANARSDGSPSHTFSRATFPVLAFQLSLQRDFWGQALQS